MRGREIIRVRGCADRRWPWAAGPIMLAIGLCVAGMSAEAAAGDSSDDDWLAALRSQSPARPAGNDDDVLEENDSCAAARIVSTGTTSNLVVKLIDDDWYRISVPAYARLTVTVDFVHANGDVDLVGYALCGGPIIAASTGMGDAESIVINNSTAAPRSYFWWVLLAGGTSNGYSMTVTIGECGADDILENNDTCATARAGSPGVSANDLIVKKSDEDWYAVTLPAFTRLSAKIGFSHVAGDLNLSLLAADCSSMIDTSTSTDDMETVEVQNATAAAVDYRIRVYMDGGSPTECNGYLLTIEMQPLLGITSAVSRRTHGSAGSIDLNLPLAGAPGSPAVECRTGGPTTIICTFTMAVDPSTGSSSVGALTQGPADNQKKVSLASIPNQSCPVIELSGITADLSGNALVGDNDVAVRVLAGDANGDAAVNIFDLIAIRNQLNQPVSAGNFRNDINADGSINIFDLIATRNALNTTVSCP